MDTPLLVASDVDGTLLDPMESVTARTAAAVAGVRAAGVPFVLVSGRPPRWIPNVAQAAGVHGYAVCGNGAVIYDIGADRVLHATTIDPVVLADVVRTVTAALPELAVAVERVGVSAHALDGHEFVVERSYEHPWPGDHAIVAPRAKLLGQPAVKLLLRHRGLGSDQLADAVNTLVDGAVDVTFSSSVGMVEISAAGVTKATGLADVAARIGVATDRIVAFGDMPNDIPMLRWAGLGVAMGNAHPDVLASADEVTGPNSRDGVAEVLERWFDPSGS